MKRSVEAAAPAVAFADEGGSEGMEEELPSLVVVGDEMEGGTKDARRGGNHRVWRGRSSRPNTPPTAGSPLLPVDENVAQDSNCDEDEEMPDVEDEEAGFSPTDDMPFRRTRRYTIT